MWNKGPCTGRYKKIRYTIRTITCVGKNILKSILTIYIALNVMKLIYIISYKNIFQEKSGMNSTNFLMHTLAQKVSDALWNWMHYFKWRCTFDLYITKFQNNLWCVCNLQTVYIGLYKKNRKCSAWLVVVPASVLNSLQQGLKVIMH